MAINKVGSKGIEDGSVATVDLAPGSVTNPKLANSSFTFDGTSVSLGASESVNVSASWQSVITADGSTGTTAVARNGYFIDTTSAAHTLTLPTSATIGDFIAIKDYAGTFATNNLTIGRNGHNIQGVANDSLITTNRASLVLVYVDSTKGLLYWEEHNVADLEGPTFISATGGTITTTGNFKIHTFTGDGCFVVSSLSRCRPIDGPKNVDYLVVAGGGGGGGTPCGGNQRSGGGGAGGYRESSGADSGCYTASPLGCGVPGITVTATTYPITVGGGGTGTYGSNTNGSNSVFSTITSAGGGKGASESFPSLLPAGNGGSGGGGASNSTCGGTGNSPPVSPPQGNNGGNSTGYFAIGGGGGGAGEAGGTDSVGAGGDGVSSSITGSSITRSGGGAAGPPGGVPGDGGGGDQSLPGTANTGGGGGGGHGSPNIGGGTGGKGIVIIRYKFQ